MARAVQRRHRTTSHGQRRIGARTIAQHHAIFARPRGAEGNLPQERHIDANGDHAFGAAAIVDTHHAPVVPNAATAHRMRERHERSHLLVHSTVVHADAESQERRDGAQAYAAVEAGIEQPTVPLGMKAAKTQHPAEQFDIHATAQFGNGHRFAVAAFEAGGEPTGWQPYPGLPQREGGAAVGRQACRWLSRRGRRDGEAGGHEGDPQAAPHRAAP